MKRCIPIWIALLVVVALCGQCKDNYVSPYTSPRVGYLVVGGFISGNVPIRYMLSRTLPLPGDTTIPKEEGAAVQVEGSPVIDSINWVNGPTGLSILGSSIKLAQDVIYEQPLNLLPANGWQLSRSVSPITAGRPIFFLYGDCCLSTFAAWTRHIRSMAHTVSTAAPRAEWFIRRPFGSRRWGCPHRRLEGGINFIH